MTAGENIDHDHLLLIGAGPGVGAAIVRRFGREGFHATLLAHDPEKLEQLAEELRGEGIGIDTVVADIADLDSYRTKLEAIYRAENAPGVVVYNASMLAPDDILTSTVEHLRTAYDIDVLGGVVAAQVVAPALREAGRGTILFTGGGFADNPVPVLASLSIGKAGLRAAATLVAEGVGDDNVHAASVTIVGQVKPGTDFDPNNISEMFWTAHGDAKDQWQSEYRFEGK